MVGGDFNAPNEAWGYGYTTAKGRRLWQDLHDAELTHITDPTAPTRTGTSTARDTTPDLTAQFKWTDWDKFRKHRAEQRDEEAIDDIEVWMETLNGDVNRATQTVTPEVQSKSAQRSNLQRLLHKERATATDRQIVTRLLDKYFPRRADVQHGDYTAPGPDKVTNKTLRNLDDVSISALTTYINKCWREGRLPEAWKRSKAVLIPKPGKPSSLDHLRPISLTSCVGKVMEHAFLTRINSHLEDTGAYPPTMVGFRSHLSTQDIMLQLYHQSINDPTSGTRAILGLDLEKAFDNVAHAAILRRINKLNLGERSYNYIRDFLSRRTVTLTVDTMTSDEHTLGSAGTPQGSVISPLLFNLVMMGFPVRLGEIDGLHHALYADDITLWVDKGSDGQIECTLQAAVSEVEDYLRDTGLRISPLKSELLIYRPRRRSRPTGEPRQCELIQLYTQDGSCILQVPKIRVLGMHIAAKGSNGETIRKIEGKVTAATRLIKRITNKHTGMKEDSVMRLIHSFVISHVTYVAAFHNWTVTEREKLNTLIRKTYKIALGLPESTSTTRLLQLGVYNTLEEIADAQRVSQLERMSLTATGRYILQKLGLNYHVQHGQNKPFHTTSAIR
ncbi:uncharacterized protein LOC119403510 [Rhipicephalus sanguineus]|uniref:uncharacterized protein LOC119403510 n=1 Tax=Rhipicephalus sanguineus TaxID=34632 RepID=UPI001894FC1E|nr:uncharacterized protein LOC119403510 [Rhipicephalus sanguineus]